MHSDIEHLRFPIGKFQAPDNITESHISTWIGDIASLPDELKRVTAALSEDQLNTRYRPGGWTLKQVIHHLADSHMNAYIRFKLAVTEDNPTIRPYFEEFWAECEEAKNADISISINLLEALHKRLVLFLRSLSESDWRKTYYHPESKNTFVLKEVAGMYSWHGKHHLNHILITL